MRPIHRGECLQGPDDLRAAPCVQSARRRESKDTLRDTPSGLMLSQQRVDEVDQLPALLEAREHLFLLGFLVVIVDEVAHDAGSIVQERRIKILAVRELANSTLIDQQ